MVSLLGGGRIAFVLIIIRPTNMLYIRPQIRGGGYWRNGSVNRAYAADNNVKAHLQLSVLYNLRKLMTIGSYERLFMWLFTP